MVDELSVKGRGDVAKGSKKKKKGGFKQFMKGEIGI